MSSEVTNKFSELGFDYAWNGITPIAGFTSHTPALEGGAVVLDPTHGPSYDVDMVQLDGSGDYISANGAMFGSGQDSTTIAVVATVVTRNATEVLAMSKSSSTTDNTMLRISSTDSGKLEVKCKFDGSNIFTQQLTKTVADGEVIAAVFVNHQLAANRLLVINGVDYTSELPSIDGATSLNHDRCTFGADAGGLNTIEMNVHHRAFKSGSITAAEAIDLTNKMLETSNHGGYAFSTRSSNYSPSTAGAIPFDTHDVRGISVVSNEKHKHLSNRNYFTVFKSRIDRTGSVMGAEVHDRTAGSDLSDTLSIHALNRSTTRSSGHFSSGLSTPVVDSEIDVENNTTAGSYDSDYAAHLSVELMEGQSALSVSGQNGLSGSDYVLFNLLEDSCGSKISYSSTTGILDLKGGSAYAILSSVPSDGASGFMQVELYNHTSGSSVSDTLAPSWSMDGSGGSIDGGGILHVVSPSSDTQYAIKKVGGTHTPNSDGCMLLVIEITGQYDFSTFDQSTGLTNGTPIHLTHVSGDMTYEDVNYSRELESGKGYIMLGRLRGSADAATDNLTAAWDDGSEIGKRALARPVGSTSGASSCPWAIAVMSPDADTDVSFDFITNNSMTGASGSTLIMEIGEGAIPTADPVQYGNNYMMIAAGHYREWLEKQEKEKKKNNNQGV